ncbi:MAG: hypothetical protein HOO06_11795 [Bdellovibrionaceae bacterium]|jgi:hypothetical protein|nr:hypothetical protein [Pseudobdellovibrionaceae bacterium]
MTKLILSLFVFTSIICQAGDDGVIQGGGIGSARYAPGSEGNNIDFAGIKHQQQDLTSVGDIEYFGSNYSKNNYSSQKERSQFMGMIYEDHATIDAMEVVNSMSEVQTHIYTEDNGYSPMNIGVLFASDPESNDSSVKYYGRTLNTRNIQSFDSVEFIEESKDNSLVKFAVDYRDSTASANVQNKVFVIDSYDATISPLLFNAISNSYNGR